MWYVTYSKGTEYDYQWYSISKKRKIDADKSLELRQQFLSPRQNARRFQSSFFWYWVGRRCSVQHPFTGWNWAQLGGRNHLANTVWRQWAKDWRPLWSSHGCTRKWKNMPHVRPNESCVSGSFWSLSSDPPRILHSVSRHDHECSQVYLHSLLETSHW